MTASHIHISEGVTDGVAEARAHLKVLETSGFPRLLNMRSEGVIKAFGAGMNSMKQGKMLRKSGLEHEYAKPSYGRSQRSAH